MGINGDPKGRVEGSGNGGFGGVLGAIRDVPDGIAVDADAGDGAVDLEAGLEVEDRAVGREAHDDQRRRRDWLGDGFIGFQFRRRRLWVRTASFGEGGGGDVAGEVGFVSLPTHIGPRERKLNPGLRGVAVADSSTVSEPHIRLGITRLLSSFFFFSPNIETP